MDLVNDVLNIILSFAKHPESAIVCKNWYSIIIENAKVCSKCNKITKIYSKYIWKTDYGDLLCHMHAKHKKIYKILDVKITNLLPLKGLFEKLLVMMPSINICMQFISSNENCIKLCINNFVYEFVDENSNIQYFDKFVGKTEKIHVNVNVYELYTFIKYLNDNEPLLFRINNNGNLEIKGDNIMNLYTHTLIDYTYNSYGSDCIIEINSIKFSKMCNDFIDDTGYVTIECFTNKIICTSKDTNKKYIYELFNSKNYLINMHNGVDIVSIKLYNDNFGDSQPICGLFKFKNISQLEYIKQYSKCIKIYIQHDKSTAIEYSDSQGRKIFYVI